MRRFESITEGGSLAVRPRWAKTVDRLRSPLCYSGPFGSASIILSASSHVEVPHDAAAS